MDELEAGIQEHRRNKEGQSLPRHRADVTEDEYDRLFGVNVKGTFFCCQETAKRMRDGGRIVSLSSSTTALMLPTYAADVATKGAVEQMSHVLAAPTRRPSPTRSYACARSSATSGLPAGDESWDDLNSHFWHHHPHAEPDLPDLLIAGRELRQTHPQQPAAEPSA